MILAMIAFSETWKLQPWCGWFNCGDRWVLQSRSSIIFFAIHVQICQMGHWHVWHNLTPSCSSPLSWWNFCQKLKFKPKKSENDVIFGFSISIIWKILVKIAKFLHLVSLSFLIYGQIWLNLPMDDHHVGYIIKLTKKQTLFTCIIINNSNSCSLWKNCNEF